MVVGRDAACQPVWRDADMLVVRGGQEFAAPSPAGLEVMRRGYGCTLYGIGIDDLERAVARGMRYDYPVVVLCGFERDPDDDESLAARKAVVEGHVDPSSVGRWSGPLFAGRQLRRLPAVVCRRAGRNGPPPVRPQSFFPPSSSFARSSTISALRCLQSFMRSANATRARVDAALMPFSENFFSLSWYSPNFAAIISFVVILTPSSAFGGGTSVLDWRPYGRRRDKDAPAEPARKALFPFRFRPFGHRRDFRDDGKLDPDGRGFRGRTAVEVMEDEAQG